MLIQPAPNGAMSISTSPRPSPPPNAPNLQTVPHTFLPNASRTDLAAPGQAGLPRRREAKSGAAFIRRLGLKLNSTKESKLSSFGWNVGVRQISTEPPTVVVHANEITSPEEFKKLAWVYFDKVDPCYGFIDKRFLRATELTMEPVVASSSISDSVLAGVAALGCLFSQRNATITDLSLNRTADYSLQSRDESDSPGLYFWPVGYFAQYTSG